MRLLICAGGTGGGVYPAIAVYEALQDLLVKGSQPGTSQPADLQLLWLGGEGGMETRLVERYGIPYMAIPAAGVHGVDLWTLPRNLWQVIRGISASRHILREFKPDVLFFTGGYVAVPMALAGMRIPTLLYVPDIEPGLALKTLAHFADRIMLTSQDSRRYFKHAGRLQVCGYPTRRELASWTRSAGRRFLKLDGKSPVLLIVGGSKGARSINTAVMENLPALLKLAQVIHVTGELDWPALEVKTRRLSSTQSARYHAFPYLHEQMGAVLASADLVISRAGASTLGEYPLFNLPAILVPYPHAWRYQKVNADYLVRHGAAVILADASLADRLLPTVRELIGNPRKLASMRLAMQSMSRRQAAEEIGCQLIVLSRERR